MTTILHVITGLGSGGAERMLTRIATSPGPSRHVVVSLMDEGLYGAQLRAQGIDLACLGMKPGRPTPAALWRLAATMRRVRPDVVMTWLYHADLLGTLAGLATGTGPVIWNLRCSDMDFARYRFATRAVVWLLARMSGLPWAVAANSHAGRKAHAALGYAPRRWIHLPNGFDLAEWRSDEADRQAVRRELGLAEDAVVFGTMARVDPQKDHGTLLAAAAQAAAADRRAHFVLAGRGTDRLDLPPPLAGRVTLLGERRDIPRLLRGMDVAVLSSAYGEGFPNTVGEAMATGLPCIVTDVGDSAELIGSAGLVVPPRDAGALAGAMLAMLEADRADLGRQARRRVEENWGIERVRARYAELFELSRAPAAN